MPGGYPSQTLVMTPNNAVVFQIVPSPLSPFNDPPVGGVARVQVTGSFTGSAIFEESLDNATWWPSPFAFADAAPLNGVPVIMAPGTFTVKLPGMTQLRVRCIVAGTGSAIITAAIVEGSDVGLNPFAGQGGGGGGGGGGGSASSPYAALFGQPPQLASFAGIAGWNGTTVDAFSAAATGTTIPLGTPGAMLVTGGGPNGNVTISGVLADTTSSVGTPNVVTVTSSSTLVLPANPLRVNAVFYNSGLVALWLGLGFAPSLTQFTLILAPGEFFALPVPFVGAINGIAAGASGTIQATELT